MNEELAKEFLSIIQETRGGLRDGVDAAMDTVPDIIKQMLVYGACESSIILIMCVFLLVFLVYFFYWAKKNTYQPNDDPMEPNLSLIWAGVICAFFGLFALMGIGYNFMNLIKIIFVPKLYLIDELSRMIAGP